MKKLITFVFLAFCGCSCPPMHEIKVPVPVSKKDMYLTCKMLHEERKYAEAMLAHNMARKQNVESYAVYPVCYPFATAKVDKAIEAYQQRISYLTDLMVDKGCSR